MKFSSFLLFFLMVCCFAYAQDSTMVVVHGKVYNVERPSDQLPDLMIINLRTSQGFFGKADGTFSVATMKDDTILVAVTGFEYKKITFRDSVFKNEYLINIPVIKLNITLKEVTIFSTRDLESIYNDIEKLGYNKKDFQLSGVDAFASPITFLYQQFSRREQLKIHNAERINEEKRKDLLRQLLENYVSHDIINLDEGQFDDFINYCNVPEDFMKSATQYDFCIYIKRKFELYMERRVR